MSLKLNERYPGRFNNPTSSYPQGSFKNRTAPNAKDGSYLEQDWANDKEGFFQSLISAAGITPNGAVDAVGNSQLYNAILKISQNQAGVCFATGGTSTALTLSPNPPATEYSSTQSFNVTFNVNSGTNPTINISSLGAKFLKQYSSTGAKIAASFTAGQISDIRYDGVDFVVVSQLPNSSGTTRPQFDSTTSLATTEFVQRSGVQYSRILNLTTSSTLVPINCAGALVTGVSSSNFNVTLPAASSMPSGTTVTFWNFSSGIMTVVRAGSDFIYMPSALNSVSLAIGDKLTLVSNGSSGWLNIEKPKSSTDFSANGASRNADSGEIIQWMEVAIGDIPSGGRTIDITWPFAFPNAIVNVPSIVLRSADATVRHVSTAYYSMATVSGCRLQIDEAAQVVQPASLTAIVTARGR